MRKLIGALATGAMILAGSSFATISTAQAEPGGYRYGGGHYGGHYGGHSRGFRGGHHRGGRHHGGHGAGYALLGLGAGLLLYSAIDSANDRRATVRYGYDSRDAIVHGGGYYAPPSAARQVYEAKQPRYAPAPEAGQAYGQIASSCVQTREYQTTIVIAGEEKDAYGTACLQPDGSWVLGAPQMALD